MTVRTSKKTVTFKNPFNIKGLSEVFSPGNYVVETDEELIEGLSFDAYHRILTVIQLPPTRRAPGLTRTLPITPQDLDAALKRDEEYVYVPPVKNIASTVDAPIAEPKISMMQKLKAILRIKAPAVVIEEPCQETVWGSGEFSELSEEDIERKLDTLMA